MRLLAELPWRCWILPVLLVAVWALLWVVPVRRRTRLWLVGFAPPACVAGIVIGVITMVGGDGSTAGDHCAESRSCGGGQAAHWAYALNSISDLGLAIVANALLAGGVSLVLLVITAAVELPRMAADQEPASRPQGTRVGQARVR